MALSNGILKCLEEFEIVLTQKPQSLHGYPVCLTHGYVHGRTDSRAG